MSRCEQRAEGVTVHLGDMLEILPALGAMSHVITDPPYEDVFQSAFKERGNLRTDGAASFRLLNFEGINAIRGDAAKAIVAASDGWALVFSIAEGVMAWRDVLQAADAKWDTTLAWVKPDATPRLNGQGAARSFECVMTCWCGKGYRKWNCRGKRGVYTHHCNPPERDHNHPTEKPVKLMCELVLDFTQPGDLVCDPFMGSGSTGIACVKTGRRFVGIEKDPKWFDLACRRISDQLRRPDLFVERPAPLKQGGLAL